MATLKQIRNFLILAEELHFARAAEKLMISQAALSMEIKKLENSVGCQLFDRSDRWMIRLTEAGETYLQRIKILPELLHNARKAAQRAARGESGTLSIVVANVVYDCMDVGEIFQKMCREFPDVKLHIQDRLSSSQSADLIRSGQCDVGLLASIHGADVSQNLRHINLLDTPFGFAFPARHPLADKPDLQVTDLTNCSFIFPPREEAPLLRQAFENFFITNCRKVPDIAHEAVGLRAIRQLVRAGLGVALIPRENAEPGIVFRQLDHGMQRSIIAAWDENNHSAALRNFLQLINKAAGKFSRNAE